MTQTEFETSKRRSENKFDTMMVKLKVDLEFFSHRKWADERNYSVTHLGFNHTQLDILCFDTLCASLSVNKQVIYF